MSTGDRQGRTLDLTPSPEPFGRWLAEVWSYREVLDMLARKDFQTRYKRASFGVVWAVAVPLLQAAVMAVVFTLVVHVPGSHHFAVYVMSGVIPFSYFSTVVLAGTTAIVDGSSLTDKVWFPRVLLVMVPAISNLVGFAVTVIVLLAFMPVFGVSMGAPLLFFVPAIILLVAFTTGLSMVLAALDVYFRDVKFLVTAALMIWIYLTPILYPQGLLRGLGPWLEANPLTGIIVLFHMATVGSQGSWIRPVVISVIATAILLVVGVEAQRRHDRLFVDLM